MKDNEKTIIIVFLVLLLFFSFNWSYGHMSMMFFGPIFMLLILVLIVWLIISLTQENKYKRI